jgi:hypothetical protein
MANDFNDAGVGAELRKQQTDAASAVRESGEMPGDRGDKFGSSDPATGKYQPYQPLPRRPQPPPRAVPKDWPRGQNRS